MTGGTPGYKGWSSEQGLGEESVHLCMETGRESWGCSAWRREGSREPLRKMETHFLAGPNRTNGNGFKLKEDRFRLDIRNIISMMRLVKQWNMLPKEDS